MLRIGVAGLMASGKSSVAKRFQEHGAVLVEGDALGWAVLQDSNVRDGLRACFGDTIVAPDGAVDRGALGRIAFRDAAAMERLNAVVQPVLERRVRGALFSLPGDGVAVLDAALISTWRLETDLDGVVEVFAPAEIRAERLRSSKGFTDAEARERILGQDLPPVRGARRYWRIENTGTRAALLAGADGIWGEIIRLRPGGRTD
jgi:dephospho-CoA kinase